MKDSKNETNIFAKESIIKHNEVISPEYTPNQIVHRDEKIHDIAYALKPALRGTLPSNLTIFGNSGTGKTLVCNYVFSLLKEEEGKKDLDHDIKIIKIKGQSKNTKHKAFVYAYRKLLGGSPPGRSTTKVKDGIVNYLKKNDIVVIFFIDEIHEFRIEEANNLLYTLSRLTDSVGENSHTSFVAVSNDPRLREKLKDNTRSSLMDRSMVFKRYSEGELYDILKDRITSPKPLLKEGSYNDDHLKYIAELSREEGDARYALRLLYRSAEMAEKNNEKELSKERIKETNSYLRSHLIKDIIQDLPLIHRRVLWVISEMHGDVPDIYSNVVYRRYKDRFDDSVSNSRLSQVITELGNNKIIIASSTSKGKSRKINVSDTIDVIRNVIDREEIKEE